RRPAGDLVDSRCGELSAAGQHRCPRARHGALSAQQGAGGAGRRPAYGELRRNQRDAAGGDRVSQSFRVPAAAGRFRAVVHARGFSAEPSVLSRAARYGSAWRKLANPVYQLQHGSEEAGLSRRKKMLRTHSFVLAALSLLLTTTSARAENRALLVGI